MSGDTRAKQYVLSRTTFAATERGRRQSDN
nr:MAG TPA_asm: hypothetical protein [Caudoviricetes sp.]